jgi:lysophospholipase L1-like esterase
MSLSLGMVIGELTLQLFAYAAPRLYARLAGTDYLTEAVPDARLGMRPSPSFPEHDTNGFRNRAALRTASIVALGDSQTYGASVAPEQAWPQQLEQLAGGRETVYNMAWVGWGQIQSLYLFDEAIRLKPRLIIAALYSGNDFYDCFSMVYDRNQSPELRSRKARVLQAIADANRNDPLKERIERHYAARRPLPPPRYKELLGRYCRTYQLLSCLKQQLQKSPERSWVLAQQEVRRSDGSYLPFESGTVRTVLTPRLRRVVISQADPRIAEGFRISLQALRRMSARARAENAQFAVLLIPTKELVFRDLVVQTIRTVPAPYAALIREESMAFEKAKAFLRGEDIPYIDALPALRRALARGSQPYPVDTNGHMTAAGHRAVAEAVLTAVPS